MLENIKLPHTNIIQLARNINYKNKWGSICQGMSALKDTPFLWTSFNHSTNKKKRKDRQPAIKSSSLPRGKPSVLKWNCTSIVKWANGKSNGEGSRKAKKNSLLSFFIYFYFLYNTHTKVSYLRLKGSKQYLLPIKMDACQHKKNCH